MHAHTMTRSFPKLIIWSPHHLSSISRSRFATNPPIHCGQLGRQRIEREGLHSHPSCRSTFQLQPGNKPRRSNPFSLASYDKFGEEIRMSRGCIARMIGSAGGEMRDSLACCTFGCCALRTRLEGVK